MKASVTIEKSFDDGWAFTKQWQQGDFEEFFKEEGGYLDRLCGTIGEHGKAGDEFTVTYTVKVTK